MSDCPRGIVATANPSGNDVDVGVGADVDDDGRTPGAVGDDEEGPGGGAVGDDEDGLIGGAVDNDGDTVAGRGDGYASAEGSAPAGGAVVDAEPELFVDGTRRRNLPTEGGVLLSLGTSNRPEDGGRTIGLVFATV